MRFNNVIGQAQAQTCSLPGRFCSKEWLKYFVKHSLRNTITIVPDFYHHFSIVLFRYNGNSWLIAIKALFLFFIHCIKGIIDQVENDAANVLWHDLYFRKCWIKIGFKSCTEAFVL